MEHCTQLAKHLRDVYFGGNWTWVNYKDTLADLTCEEVNQKIDSLNTIVALVYHTNYYVRAITKVLQKQELDSKDKFSFNHPPIQSQQEWEDFRDETYKEAENLATMIEQLPDSILSETFVNDKYGNYYRNFLGLIEHCHYHLGQIVILKKLIRQKKENEVSSNQKQEA